MSLTIVDLNNPEQISKIGAEYISTGFMFDVPETNKDFEQQMASFDFVSVDYDPTDALDTVYDINYDPDAGGN